MAFTKQSGSSVAWLGVLAKLSTNYLVQYRLHKTSHEFL